MMGHLVEILSYLGAIIVVLGGVFGLAYLLSLAIGEEENGGGKPG